MGCASSAHEKADPCAVPGQHRYSCDDTECPGCSRPAPPGPLSPTSSLRKSPHRRRPSSDPWLGGSQQFDYMDEVVDSCALSRGRSSRASSCGEPSPMRAQLRQVKAVLAAKLFSDVNGDPDQFAPEAIAQPFLDDAVKAVVGSGWLDAAVEALQGDDDIVSIKSMTSLSHYSDALTVSVATTATTGTRAAHPSANVSCNGRSDSLVMPPGFVEYTPRSMTTTVAESPTSCSAGYQLSTGGRRKPCGALVLTERALMRLAESCTDRPGCAALGGSNAATPRATAAVLVSLSPSAVLHTSPQPFAPVPSMHEAVKPQPPDA